ncbi:MAG: helix-turn-helix domain-containing protein [Nocardioidaceae bacterium]|nr:helix-turn-helix domain-containing protein [Nocardioidaceae bacterium]
MLVEASFKARTPSLRRRAVIHSALSEPHRLSIVDELVLSDRSPNELGAALDIGSNLLAHHLRVLEDARLIERRASSADGRRKYLHLLPEGLEEMHAPAASIVARNVLFVCTANSARSQLAAAIWNTRHAVPASSAGTRPAQAVHPGAVAAAARIGLDLSNARPRSIDKVSSSPDLVVTVCDVAREDLDRLPAEATFLHWSIPDPAPVGTDRAFDKALGTTGARVESLAPYVRRLPTKEVAT